MKRIIMTMLILGLLAVGFAGCGSVTDNSSEGDSVVVDSNPLDSGSADADKGSDSSKDSNQWQPVLYFSDSDGINIIKETRNLEADENLTVEEKAKACVEELIKGPKSSGLMDSIPDASKVRSVVKEGDTLVVDLSEEFDRDNVGGSTGTTMAVAPIVLTLTDLEGVEKVKFKIGGKDVGDFKGHYDFTRPFERADFEQYIQK